MRVDLAVVGGGGAGLLVLLALDATGGRPGSAGASVALVDPVHRAGRDRTWCWWDAGRSAVEPVDDVVHRAWRQVEVVRGDGEVLVLDLAPLRYAMMRSQDLYALAGAAAQRLGVVRVAEAATEVVDGAERATVVAGDSRIEARWVLDSRPAAPVRPARTALLQHFRGWTLRAERPVLDPGRPVLMDFRTPQPDRGLTFGYVLPDDERTGLVEYTEFSPARLDDAAYERALSAYVDLRLGGAAYEVLEVEDGAIPMTDAVRARRVGRRVVRLGTAGGATRPATGYTFAAMQRQARAIAVALRDGRDPVPPRPYPPRHALLDGALLHGLDTGVVDGPELFVRLLTTLPPELVLRFLDGATSPAEDLRVMRASPRAAMLRAGLGLLRPRRAASAR